MTRKEQPFYWRRKQEEAFEKLRDKFTSTFILASFNPEKKMILKTDVLDQVLESCLS